MDLPGNNKDKADEPNNYLIQQNRVDEPNNPPFQQDSTDDPNNSSFQQDRIDESNNASADQDKANTSNNNPELQYDRCIYPEVVAKRPEVTTYQLRKNPKVPTNIQIDGHVYAYKDALISNKNGSRYVLKCCQRKICSAYIHIPEKFDFERLKTTKEEPAIHVLNVRSNYDVDIVDDYTVLGFNMPHKCNKVGFNVVQVNITEADFDVVYFSNLAKHHHWKGPEYLKEQAKLDGKFFGRNQVEKFLIAYRKLNEPTEEASQFTSTYGKTIDEPDDKRQLFFQARGEIVDSITGKSLRYVILSAKFSLGILCKSKRWYLDSTFRCSPVPFKQVVTIIGKYLTHNYPCVFILMDSKKKIAYTTAFTQLKIIMESYNLVVEKDIIVSADFEEGMAYAIKIVFDLKTEGSFFHYVRGLWITAKRMGLLKSTEYFEETKLLVLFLKILTQVDLDMRDSYYQTLYYKFKEKGQEYVEFLLYFKKHILDHYFLKFPRVSREQAIEKNHNVAESFNAAFNKGIGIYKPELSVFMDKLKQIEYDYRKSILEKFEQGEFSLYSNSKDLKLPFTEISLLMELNREQIVRYPFQTKEERKTSLYEKLEKLVDECYEFIYGDTSDALDSSYNSGRTDKEPQLVVKKETVRTIYKDSYNYSQIGNTNQAGKANQSGNRGTRIPKKGIENPSSDKAQLQEGASNSVQECNYQKQQKSSSIMPDYLSKKSDMYSNAIVDDYVNQGYRGDSHNTNQKKNQSFNNKDSQLKLLEAIMRDDEEEVFMENEDISFSQWKKSQK